MSELRRACPELFSPGAEMAAEMRNWVGSIVRRLSTLEEGQEDIREQLMLVAERLRRSSLG